MTSKQPVLFRHPKPPTTRYQGSKQKLVPWIIEVVKELEFSSCLDAFGGTGVVSHALKTLGKSVTYNDIQPFNWMIGKAIIENDDTTLRDPRRLLLRTNKDYSSFIADTFPGIYFTDEENAWLDTVTQNILQVSDETEKALAFYALFQSCLAKRPYNLFHRANLYMRTQDVNRSFGNKTTWDKPFEEHFLHFVREVNDCIFTGDQPCHAKCCDAAEIDGEFDLVYIDPPYINGSGTGVDYGDFYHFLNGIVDYPNWGSRIDTRRKHLPLLRRDDPWSDKSRIAAAFDRLFARFRDSIIVVSYRSDGTPEESQLFEILASYKTVHKIQRGTYKYVLSTNTHSQEILLVGQ